MREKYLPTWESLDSRPLPQWYDDAKLGIFIHWGIYSLPAFAPRRSEVELQGQAYAEWFAWFAMQEGTRQRKFLKENYGANSTYEDLAPLWKGELFDADRWMRLVKRSGAKYVIPVSKHHDAFCLWPSDLSWNWNSADIGLHRDVIGELMRAADKYGIVRGIYYSLLEFNVTHKPEWPIDPNTDRIRKYAKEKMLPQLKDLVTRYEPKLLFGDGCWDYESDHWMSKEFLAWLYNESPVRDSVIVNDRWGDETMGRHGGYLTCEYGNINNVQVSEEEMNRILAGRKYEECRSVGESFGFNRNEGCDDYMTERELITFFVKTVSRGGNLNLNVGPCADGTIPAIAEERLEQLGDWLAVNGEGIYGSRKCSVQGLPDYAVATRRGDNVYVFCEKFPVGEDICLRGDMFDSDCSVSLLGSRKKIAYAATRGQVQFRIPMLGVDDMPCRCVYGFRIRKK